MPPFASHHELWQAFTAGELWTVPSERWSPLVSRGVITGEQARKFGSQGVIGSHLEMIRRRDGFKGFDQSGVSSIIRDTDARRS
jgi:hypothetical protein